MKGFTGIYILIGIVIIAVLAGAAYLGKLPVKLPVSQSQISISPTPQAQEVDETANWKTYTNSTYKFSFKYPSNWVHEDSADLGLGVASEERRGGYHLILGDPNRKVPAGNGKTMISGSISMHIYNKQNYAFFSENIDSYYKKATNKKSVETNDLDAQEIHHQSCSTNNDCISVIFNKNGNIFTFDTWVWDERYRNLDTIYKILSTFKFN